MNKEKFILRMKIKNIKHKLSKLDYKTNKYVEGELTDAEWQEVVTQRKELRNQINALEEQLGELK